MEILGVSDWIDPLIYSDQMKYRMKNVDIIISCGDISINYLDFIMSELDKPLFFVVGNHVNAKRYKKNIFGQLKLDIPECFKNLHLKVYYYKGYILSGFQGSVWYNGGPFQYKQWEVYLQLLKLVPRLIYNKIKYGRYIDIFVTHSAPSGIGDKNDPCHQGLKAFNWFIKLFKPKYFLHGHIHIYDKNENRVFDYYGTKVINCCGYYKISINDDIIKNNKKNKNKKN